MQYLTALLFTGFFSFVSVAASTSVTLTEVDEMGRDINLGYEKSLVISVERCGTYQTAVFSEEMIDHSTVRTFFDFQNTQADRCGSFQHVFVAPQQTLGLRDHSERTCENYVGHDLQIVIQTMTVKGLVTRQFYGTPHPFNTTPNECR